jgi:hypothetical protein
VIFAIFSCAYIPLLVPGAVLHFFYDRYALPLFPLLVIFVLLTVQSQIRRVPALAWACLLLFAVYATATTHDYFSALRARVSAAQTLEKQAVPRSRISAGVEYDGWTQLQVTGTIRAVLYGDKIHLNSWNTFWFWGKTTALQPDYVVTYWPASDLPAERLTCVPFRTWLPPFQRTVVALKRADLPKAPLRPAGGH